MPQRRSATISLNAKSGPSGIPCIFVQSVIAHCLQNGSRVEEANIWLRSSQITSGKPRLEPDDTVRLEEDSRTPFVPMSPFVGLLLEALWPSSMFAFNDDLLLHMCIVALILPIYQWKEVMRHAA